MLKKYCAQIVISFPFSKTDKIRTYELIGFKSDSGGYECRNSWMKICAGAKSHTTIKGNKEKCIIFEGFFDFLSYLTHYRILEPKYTAYVLNGAGQFRALNQFIGSKEVLYYGDNDAAGDLIASEIKNLKDMRYIYSFYNDFNKYLVDL